jgi:hypothetical protein
VAGPLRLRQHEVAHELERRMSGVSEVRPRLSS